MKIRWALRLRPSQISIEHFPLKTQTATGKRQSTATYGCRLRPSYCTRTATASSPSMSCNSKDTHRCTVTHKDSNSPAQQYTSDQADIVTPSYSSTTLAPPSFPSSPGSSILMDCRLDSLEGSYTAENHASRWTDKESTGRCLCT